MAFILEKRRVAFAILLISAILFHSHTRKARVWYITVNSNTSVGPLTDRWCISNMYCGDTTNVMVCLGTDCLFQEKMWFGKKPISRAAVFDRKRRVRHLCYTITSICITPICKRAYQDMQIQQSRAFALNELLTSIYALCMGILYLNVFWIERKLNTGHRNPGSITTYCKNATWQCFYKKTVVEGATARWR